MWHHAQDLIIGFKNGKISIMKNRDGYENEDADLVDVLEAIMPHMKTYAPIVEGWIEKLKVLRPFD